MSAATELSSAVLEPRNERVERSLEFYRRRVEELNVQILDLLSRRAEVVAEIRAEKEQLGMPLFSPEREAEMLEALVQRNRGPFSNDTIKKLFKEIFRASLSLMEEHERRRLRVSRDYDPCPIRVTINGEVFGERACRDGHSAGAHASTGGPERASAQSGLDKGVLIAGPCAVESEAQLVAAAAALHQANVRIMRAGIFKPRTSPDAFQGLGQTALPMLREVASRFGLAVATEITDPRQLAVAIDYLDVIQIGARNMYNYDLLREVGHSKKPVILKRGLSATIEELTLAAEYILREGNEQVILCERGIRTFERETRNTLDIAAVPVLRQSTRLPVIVDVSHAAGRKDILAALARAALAAGADGLLVEMHPWPRAARSDAHQQLSVEEFRRFVEEVGLTRYTASRAVDRSPS